MCCNYCFHFEECKKATKTNPNCCPECAEYEYCPFVLGEASIKDFDSPFGEGDSDIDIFDGDVF